jgi:hypothetical protein
MSALYPWQADEVAEHALVGKRGLFASPRVGKTRATIESMVRAGGFRRAVVLAPLAVAPFWLKQLREAGFEARDGFSGTMQQVGTELEMDRPEGVLVLNYERLPDRYYARTNTIVPGLLDTVLAWKPQALVADESHYIKGPTTDHAKAARRIAKRAGWVRLLTGTPSPNDYGDLWGQLVCVDDRPLPDGWGSWTAFKNRHLVMDAVYPSRRVGHVNIPELQARLVRDARFVRREDVFGADQYQEIERLVTLPDRAMEMYRTLARQWIVESPEDFGRCKADHILTRLVRLQQLAAGFLPDEGGMLHEVHDAKVKAVAADLDEIIESREKVVIFHKYRWEGARYLELAQSLLGRGGVALQIGGDTPTAERERAKDLFNETPRPAILVAQTQSAGIGISLAEATHAFFTTQTFSFAAEDQARDRIYKPGVPRVVTHFITEGTVDEYIRDIIATKSNIHESVRLADRQEMVHGKLRRSYRRIA